MQGTQIPALVREDPTGHGATKLMCTAAPVRSSAHLSQQEKSREWGVWAPQWRVVPTRWD